MAERPSTACSIESTFDEADAERLGDEDSSPLDTESSSSSFVEADPKADDFARDINKLLRGHVGKKDELKILHLLEIAPDINSTLSFVNAKSLLCSFKDHRLRTAPNRTRLLNFFSITKSPSLTIRSKVILAAGIVRRRKLDFDAQCFILSIFHSCQERDLFNFKMDLDHYAHGTTISRLCNEAITDERVRISIKLHIAEEAAKLLARPDFVPGVHALSDIDDTFVVGYGLGGPKYPKGCLIPGVVALFSSLEAHVVFITARPAATRGVTFRSLKKLVGVRSVSVLTGKLRDSILIPFKADYANELIASRKVDNFEKHAEVFPECSFIWFGDSGQSDVDVGVQLMKRKNVLGAYIQDVARDDGILLHTSARDREQFERQNVFIADNYVEVALHMHRQNLLSHQGLFDTAHDAALHLVELRERFSNPEVFQARIRELRISLARVEERLKEAEFPMALSLVFLLEKF
jgi:hypothetical protein